MSVRVMSWVWEHSRSEGTDRLVLLAIADYAHDDGTEAFPSIRKLALKARVSERTVQRSIRSLTLLGEVSVDQNAGRAGANVYTIKMVRQADTPDIVTPPSDSHPRQLDAVTAVTPRGDSSVTRTIREPSTTPQPPASGGPIAHCKRHSKYRKGCEHCQCAATAQNEERDEARRQRADCPDCLGDVWLEDGTKCTHPKTRRNHMTVVSVSAAKDVS